jgi:hypothetical protein
VHWNPVSFLPDSKTQPEWLIVYFKIGTVRRASSVDVLFM